MKISASQPASGVGDECCVLRTLSNPPEDWKSWSPGNPGTSDSIRIRRIQTVLGRTGLERAHIQYLSLRRGASREKLITGAGVEIGGLGRVGKTREDRDRGR